MVKKELNNSLDPKFYSSLTPKNKARLIEYRKNHPVKSITIDNKEHEYISCGSGDKTVLTFHGALGNAEGNFQAINFFEKKYKVIAPSITNFKNLDEFSGCVNEILKIEHVEKYILIGQSFGSMMAQPFFHRNFNNIEGLIIVNSYPPNPELVDDFKKSFKILKILPLFLLRKMMAKKLLKLADDTKEMSQEIREEFDFTMAFMRERFSQVKKSVILTQLLLTGEFNGEKYKSEDYSEWNGKCIIFTANDDNGFPYHEQLRSQYPNVEEIIFENVGHMGTLLKRDEYHENLNRFLDSLD